MAAHSRRPSALLTMVLLLTVTIAHAGINPRTPSVARGIIGETAELACGTTGGEYVVSWKRLRDQQEISHNQQIIVDDPRFSMRVNRYANIWFINIEDSTKDDEGEYICTVKASAGVNEKKVKLTMIEASDTLRWRPDSKCGDLAECDPLGAYPCCSASGWCGFTEHHCDCASCVDYTLQSTEAPPTPNPESSRCAEGYQEVSSKCLLYSSDPKTWSEATQLCASKGGRLITFETLDQLMEVVGNLTKLETAEMVAHSPGGPVWVGVSTQGHKGSDGTLQWRWVMGESKLKDSGLLEHLNTADGDRCGFLYLNDPTATIRHTGHCKAVLLPLCEQLKD